VLVNCVLWSELFVCSCCAVDATADTDAVLLLVIRSCNMSNIESLNYSGMQLLNRHRFWRLCMSELFYDLINRQLLCGKCLKQVTIQYFPAGGGITAISKILTVLFFIWPSKVQSITDFSLNDL